MKYTGHIVDVVRREVFDGEVEVNNGVITGITPRHDIPGNAPYWMPGFIDSHVHIESSMMVPAEFARVAVEQGTIGVVADPHEIGNVLGNEGIDFMIANGRHIRFNFCFGHALGEGIESGEVNDLLLAGVDERADLRNAAAIHVRHGPEAAQAPLEQQAHEEGLDRVVEVVAEGELGYAARADRVVERAPAHLRAQRAGIVLLALHRLLRLRCRRRRKGHTYNKYNARAERFFPEFHILPECLSQILPFAHESEPALPE